MKLVAHVLGRPVAELFRDGPDYVLRYLPDVPSDAFVSLAMPVSPTPWTWPRDLHPFFRQNLPEGYLLGLVREEFGPVLDGTDLSLLGVVGSRGIGRVSVLPEGSTPAAPMAGFNLGDILHGNNDEEYFKELIRTYAQAAISGVVPKFLAPKGTTDGTDPMDDGISKKTLKTDRYIIKGSDSTTPFLGFNEHHTMRLLGRVGEFPVAETQMSDDGRALVVTRFDVDGEGQPLFGLEDMCGLLGKPPHEKYANTTEEVLKAALPYLAGTQRQAQLDRFGWLLLATYIVRNADCHTKNIALRYQTVSDVEFSPAFDMVTTQAYARYASNPPALLLEGRKDWRANKTLERFFKNRLNISPPQFNAMVEAMCDAAVATGHEVIEATRNNPAWARVATGMLHAWNDGMESVRSSKPNIALRPLTDVIGHSDLPPLVKPDKDQVIGRSELLGKSGSI